MGKSTAVKRDIWFRSAKEEGPSPRSLLAMHSLPGNSILIIESQVTAPVPPTSCSSWQSSSSSGTMSNAVSTSAPPQVRFWPHFILTENEFVSRWNSLSPTIGRLLVASVVAKTQVRRLPLLWGDIAHADPSPSRADEPAQDGSAKVVAVDLQPMARSFPYESTSCLTRLTCISCRRRYRASSRSRETSRKPARQNRLSRTSRGEGRTS